jgi:hypothetical protein
MPSPIRTIELVAWDLDVYPPRPDAFESDKSVIAHDLVLKRTTYPSVSALCKEETRLLQNTLTPHAARPDLLAEMQGLDWSLGVVDLRRLLAFQRRLSIDPSLPSISIPSPSNWQGLADIAFAPPTPVFCEVIHDSKQRTITLQSHNPNLQLQSTQNPAMPVIVYAGSPFFEVATYAGRCFLRDGYHRAYHLLRAGIFHLPAVIVHARTLEELGATQPRFFSEDVLLSAHPPFVTDFLNESLTIAYDRHPILKTLRITMEESFTYPGPITTPGEQS